MSSTERYPDLASRSLLSIYRTSGLGAAMNVLLGMLQDSMRVARISSMYAMRDGVMTITLSDTHGPPRRPGLFRMMVLPERLDEVMIVDDIPALRKERGVDNDPRLAGRGFMVYRSVLRFPLFIAEERVFVIHLWSSEFKAFSMRDYETARALLEPLAAELPSALSALDNVTEPDRPEPISHYQRLAQCPGLAGVMDLLQQVAPTDAPVLITGETGVGKGEAAACIHELSKRRDRPFVHLNCGAIPESLLESELFGHERGAFTGAHAPHRGYFEQAAGGTIFMDEIGELSPSAQVRLLRIFDAGSINRVGGARAIPVDVRIVAATNCDLEKNMAAGAFRKDLWYRLALFPLEIPPLRERRQDIPPLAEYFLQAKARKLSCETPPAIPSRELALLCAHDWPGNVRELEHVIERSLILHCRGAAGGGNGGEALSFRLDGVKAEAEKASGLGSLIEGWPTLEEMEQQYIQAVLKKTRGKLTGPGGATEILDIHYATLRASMRRSGILTRRQTKRG